MSKNRPVEFNNEDTLKIKIDGELYLDDTALNIFKTMTHEELKEKIDKDIADGLRVEITVIDAIPEKTKKNMRYGDYMICMDKVFRWNY